MRVILRFFGKYAVNFRTFSTAVSANWASSTCKISAEIRNRHILAEVFVYPKQKAPAFDVGRRFFHLITDYYLISLTLITSSLDSTAVFTDSGTLSAETIV